ncbi:unnamed protein product [Ilex paraguariensis]|uniref:Uncharacterized protein n=1 Tax=Ilex paraguariensis TaxID=185542 RepID=A0ABC8TPS9_9AQUA
MVTVSSPNNSVGRVGTVLTTVVVVELKVVVMVIDECSNRRMRRKKNKLRRRTIAKTKMSIMRMGGAALVPDMKEKFGEYKCGGWKSSEAMAELLGSGGSSGCEVLNEN